MMQRKLLLTLVFGVPGLWDTHAHLSYWCEDALELLVRAGVTSIRKLGGDPDDRMPLLSHQTQ